MMNWRRIRLLLLSLLLLLSVTLALLGSQPGVQLARWAALYLVPGLQIGSVSGDWWRGLSISELHYQDQALSASIRQLQLSFDHSCWQQRQVCLTQLNITEPQLTLLSTTDSPESPSVPTAVPATANKTQAQDDAPAANNPNEVDQAAAWQLQLPLLQVDDLQFTDLRQFSDRKPITTQSASVSQNTTAKQSATAPLLIKLARLETALSLTLTDIVQVALHNSQLAALQIELPPAEPATPSPTLTNPLPALLQTSLPVQLTSQNFSLQSATLTQPGLPKQASAKSASNAAASNTVASTKRGITKLSWQQLKLDPAHWQVDGLILQLPVPAELSELLVAPDKKTADLQLELSADLHPNNSLAIALQAQHGQSTLSIKGAGPWQHWPLQLNVSQPQPAADGKPVINRLLVTGLVDLTHQQLPFELQLSAEQLQQQDLQLQQLQVKVQGDLQTQQFSVQSQLQYPQLPPLQASVNGKHQDNRLSIEPLSIATLNGTISAKLAAELSTGAVNGELNLQNIQPGLFWPDHPGTLNGRSLFTAQLPMPAGQPTNASKAGVKTTKPANNKTKATNKPVNKPANKAPIWRLAVNELVLDGDIRDLPIELRGSFELSQLGDAMPKFHSAGIRASHGPNLVNLQGDVDEQWQLNAEIKLPDLAYSLPLTEGAVQGSLHISGPVATPDLQLYLHASKLNYLDDYALDNLQLQAEIKALGQQASKVSLTASTGQAPGWQLQQLQWQLDGTLAEHHSHLALNSHQLKIAAALQAGLNDKEWQSTISELRVQSDFGDWQLASQSHFVYNRSRDELALQPLCLLEQGAALCLRTPTLLSQQQGDIQLGIGHLALSDLSALFPDNLSLEGRLDGELSVRWRAHQLQEFSYQLSSPQGLVRHQLTTAIDLPWQQLQSSGQLSAQQLKAQLTAVLQDNSPLNANINITALDSKAPQIEGALRLEPLSLKFLRSALTELQQVNGLVSANLTARGALQNPALYGQLRLDKLLLTGPQVPIELKSANLLANFSGYQASLNSHWQTPEGALDWTGHANWLTPAQWFVRMDVNGDKLHTQFLDSELVVSPKLSLTASPHSGQISGEINLPAGHIRFNSLPESATAVSDDEVIISDNQRLNPMSDWRLSSDIRLHIGEQVKLSAFGLKTRLHGDLRVRQQGLMPSLHGQVLLKDGQFRAYGQDLSLRKGRLTFNGPANQPLLAIEAIRNPAKTEDEVTAGIRVNGLADSPVVQVFSEPSKPQANALAYLLLGRDIGSSAGDGAVTTSLIGIGIANSGQLVGAIGEAFGISDLSLDTAGSGDKSKVTVSGYLSPRLQVKYGVGIFSQFGEFTLRYRLMKQFYVEAVQGLATSVDLLYKVEFD